MQVREFLSKLVAAATAPLDAVRGARDLRLDFFRGLALWFIFIDHIPDNIVSWLTVRNFGFSDATEIFVFISGYTAVIAYSSIMRQRSWVRASARILARVWQLYVAHIMLFVALTAAIGWAAMFHAKGDTFIEEMNLAGLGTSPYETLVQAALLKFRPVNLDVLPLYIVLLLSFPLMLPLVVHHPWWALGASFVIYMIARWLELNLPAHPEGKTWYFNPLAWQLLFYAGAAFASAGHIVARVGPLRRVVDVLAVAWLLIGVLVALSWQITPLSALVPDIAGRILYPIDKTGLDPARLLHFLALAYVVARLTPPDAAFLNHWYAQPVRRCGEHSLAIFCLGTFLSFVAYVVVSTYGESMSWPAGLDILVSVVGLALMVAAAYFARWYKTAETARRPTSSVPTATESRITTARPVDSVAAPRPAIADPAPPRGVALPLLLAFVLGALVAVGPSPAWSAPEKCPAAPENLELGTSLPRVKVAVQERKSIIIVALGSSSTQGYGTTTDANTYPRQLEITLAREFQDVRLKFTILNKGIGGQDVVEMLERLDRDVIARNPDLVIWQAGTNAAMKAMPLDLFKTRLSAGIDRMKKAGADVVLMTPQYVPAVVALANEEDYIVAMEAIARENGIGVFKRWQIMRDWVTGERMPYAQFIIPDGLHLNDFGNRCMGKLLAKAIGRKIQ